MKENKKDTLGNRQKSYERVNESYLVPKMPYIIRMDGMAFHTFTKGFTKPFDPILQKTMDMTCKELCKSFPYVVVGYTQSDEITLICKYPDRMNSQPYFDGRVEKITSAAAARATRFFNQFFIQNVKENVNHIDEVMYKKYESRFFKAEFDARVFNIPEWDCINNFIWRQQDCIRNSINSIAQSVFTPKELNGIHTDDLKEKLLTEKGISLEDFSSRDLNGATFYKTKREMVTPADKNGVSHIALRTVWDCSCVQITKEYREWFSKSTGLRED